MVQRELGGTLTPDDLALLSSTAGHSDTKSVETLRQAFTDAFNESMVVCAIIAGVCVLVGLFLYKRNAATPMERREMNLVQEMKRRRENQTRVGSECTSGDALEKVMYVESKGAAKSGDL